MTYRTFCCVWFPRWWCLDLPLMLSNTSAHRLAFAEGLLSPSYVSPPTRTSPYRVQGVPCRFLFPCFRGWCPTASDWSQTVFSECSCGIVRVAESSHPSLPWVFRFRFWVRRWFSVRRCTHFHSLSFWSFWACFVVRRAVIHTLRLSSWEPRSVVGWCNLPRCFRWLKAFWV